MVLIHRQAHLSNYRLRCLEDVDSGETEQAVAAVQQSILPPVVLNQAVPVASAIELKPESVLGVIEIRPPEEAPMLILE